MTASASIPPTPHPTLINESRKASPERIFFDVDHLHSQTVDHRSVAVSADKWVWVQDSVVVENYASEVFQVDLLQRRYKDINENMV